MNALVKYLQEQSLLLRVPVDLSQQFEDWIDGFEDLEVNIELFDDGCGILGINDGIFRIRLCTLPHHVETFKTFDNSLYYQSGDIHQVLVVEGGEFPSPELYQLEKRTILAQPEDINYQLDQQTLASFKHEKGFTGLVINPQLPHGLTAPLRHIVPNTINTTVNPPPDIVTEAELAFTRMTPEYTTYTSQYDVIKRDEAIRIQKLEEAKKMESVAFLQRKMQELAMVGNSGDKNALGQVEEEEIDIFSVFSSGVGDKNNQDEKDQQNTTTTTTTQSSTTQQSSKSTTTQKQTKPTTSIPTTTAFDMNQYNTTPNINTQFNKSPFIPTQTSFQPTYQQFQQQTNFPFQPQFPTNIPQPQQSTSTTHPLQQNVHNTPQIYNTTNIINTTNFQQPITNQYPPQQPLQQQQPGNLTQGHPTNTGNLSGTIHQGGQTGSIGQFTSTSPTPHSIPTTTQPQSLFTNTFDYQGFDQNQNVPIHLPITTTTTIPPTTTTTTTIPQPTTLPIQSPINATTTTQSTHVTPNVHSTIDETKPIIDTNNTNNIPQSTQFTQTTTTTTSTDQPQQSLSQQEQQSTQPPSQPQQQDPARLALEAAVSKAQAELEATEGQLSRAVNPIQKRNAEKAKQAAIDVLNKAKTALDNYGK